MKTPKTQTYIIISLLLVMLGMAGIDLAARYQQKINVISYIEQHRSEPMYDVLISAQQQYDLSPSRLNELFNDWIDDQITNN